ncbi:MAG: hypothetical protein J6563_04950 [Gilliamella sp.]|uniref:hypothetical protein n=1 Tax=Gilliamella sp. TaxID=1891236 RepID=UPI00260338A1|nr:hypothetical protein [Gilliamella sp.]MCO6552304.1 hypothetical protein [Gilliamella sp.]MCO6560450.1 hypothetical protein [Gilliamella sp.]
MEFLQIILVLIFIVALWFCFIYYLRFMSKLTYKRIIKKIESDKLSDATIIRNYNNLKKWKDCKWVAILLYNIFYKEYIKVQNMMFDAYKEGMIKRNLPL